MRNTLKKKSKLPAATSDLETEFELLQLPLATGTPFPKLTPSERVLFQRCCEIYRIADTFSRKKGFLLQVFSEYHSRSHFEGILRTHYFETDENLTKEYQPEFLSLILGTYHFIRELSLSLRHTNSLPTTLEQELTWAEANLIKLWNRIASMAKKHYGWDFKTL